MIYRLISYLYPINVKTIHSEVNGQLEVTWENGKKVLNTRNANYSYGSLHKVFQQVLPLLFKDHTLKEVLILGFGAGSVYRIIKEEIKSDCTIIGVEKDKVFGSLLNEFVQNELKQTEIVFQDAFEFIENNKAKFDLIVVDLFIDNQVLDGVLKEGFAQNIKKSLNQGGFYVHNTMLASKELERDHFIMLEGQFDLVELKQVQQENSVFICQKS